MRAVLDATGLRLVEIEFLGGWARDTDEAALAATVAGVEAIADTLGGRHVSAGEFRAGDGSTWTPPRHGWPSSPTGWPSAGCWWPWRRSRGRRCPTSAPPSSCCGGPARPTPG